MLVGRVVSPGNIVADRDDDPESKQVTLLETTWLLVLTSEVVEDSTVCVKETGEVLELVDGVMVIDVILVDEVVRGGEIVDIEVV